MTLSLVIRDCSLWRNRCAIAVIIGQVCLAAMVIAIAIAGSGCVSHPPVAATSRAAAAITADELLAGKPFGAMEAAGPSLDAGDILAVDAGMQQFIDEYVDPRANSYEKLKQLLRALISDGSFGLAYEESTHTASGTFRTRTGNCLSFTNLFIAMARETGLEVSYQEVDIPPDWSMRGDTYILNRHVNVYVDLGGQGERIVDFNIDDFKSTYQRREISDQRAYAHFFSNKGVEQMQVGNNNAGFRLFRAALKADRGFAPAWSNLAALYNRIGESMLAEAAYFETLRVKPEDMLSMSNLERLYAAQGNDELAGYYRDRVRRHRARNPYYRYSLARQAFQERRYDDAIKHLEYAVSKKQWEDSFYLLLGLSYLKTGNGKQARKWLHKAEEVAQSNALKRNYQGEIDSLLSEQ